MTRTSWVLVLDQAREIVAEYDTPVTLRQLFYRLVAAQTIPNLQSFYRRLSAQTAQGRRDGTFPDLADDASEIEGGGGYTSPKVALRLAARYYSRDHTEGQPYSIYVGVEKRGMRNQLASWFGDLDISRVALGGFGGQSYLDKIKRDVRRQGRPAILLYAGDHDPSGEDIERDFIARTDCWEETRRIALTPEQVADPAFGILEYAPTETELAKLENDPRAKAFRERHGSLVQYELDALPPDDLRYLYQTAVDEFWDEDAYQAVMDREADERAALIAFADQWPDDADEQ